mgnify:CR=1 FL=1
MRYQSTRNSEIRITSADAMLQGLARDGGLFLPRILPSLSPEVYHTTDYRRLATLILHPWFDDFTIEEIETCVNQAYASTFDTKTVVPIVSVGNRHVAELFHGPTAAFKDVALSLFPRLLVLAKEKSNIQKDLIVLVATSGDTGSAALTGFKDIEHLTILTFYPNVGISEIQRLQMTTQDGKNQKVAAIQGNFDDAQGAVKKFLGERGEDPNFLYSSANSINIGRLLPQIVYYVHAYNQLVENKTIEVGQPIDFCVPTGNFGNIFAGYLAKRMGLPIGKLICASNQNHILTDVLKTGIYDRNRQFHSTLSPSMDILVSSNLERLLWLLSDGDSDLIVRLMNDLKTYGRFVLPKSIHEKLSETISAGYTSDEMTLRTIEEVYANHRYLLDPHSAVAWSVANPYQSDRPMVILATASPFKFPASIARAMNWTIEPDLRLITTISEITGLTIPKSLSELSKKPVLHHDIVAIDAVDRYIRRCVRENV